ncbi:hypothetical protein QQ045_008710 [Rhodiola kirilowii]
MPISRATKIGPLSHFCRLDAPSHLPYLTEHYLTGPLLRKDNVASLVDQMKAGNCSRKLILGGLCTYVMYFRLKRKPDGTLRQQGRHTHSGWEPRLGIRVT